MKVPQKIVILMLLLFVMLLISCSSTQIPEGDSQAEDLTRGALLPSTDYSLYALIGPYEDLWFMSDSLNLMGTNSYPADNLIKVDAAKIVVTKDMLHTYGNIRSTNLKDLEKIESYFQSETTSRVLPEKHWGEVNAVFDHSNSGTVIGDSLDINRYIPLNEFDPDGLRLMSNLPYEPTLQLVAVGAISKDMKAINMLTHVDGLDLQLIARTYQTLNGGNVVFGAYTSDDAIITFTDETEFFQDSINGLVFLTHSSYASPLVSFLVREISEEMGMVNLSINGTNVRHLELNGVHVVVKNIGSLVYLFISNDLNEAEKLIGSIF